VIAAVRPATATFASLRVRNFRLYVAGQTVSVAGNWMQNVAVGWLVLSLSGDGGVLGLVIACRYAPILLLASWGGLIADRHDPRTLLRISACCQTVISATIGVLTLTGWIGVASLAALILAAGVVDVCEVPSRQTILHRLVGPDLVGNAVALNSIAINVARVLGPVVAGLLVVWVGTGWCFVANAATYLAVFAGLQALRIAQLHTSESEVAARGQIRAGLRYVRDQPDLRVPLLLVAMAGAFAWEFPVTVPLLTSVTFGGDATAYGWALACLAAGSVAGGLLTARARDVGTRAVALAGVVWGVTLLAVAAAPTLAVAYALFVLVGVGAVAFNAISKTVLQVRSADRMRGRVMALWSTGWQGTTVIGAPVVGFVGEWVGPRAGLGLGGVTTLLAGGTALLLSARRRRRAGRASGPP
jgi:MFS family permease